MNDMENVYRELHGIVRHGQKQGFVAGVAFSVGVLAYVKTRENRRLRNRSTNHMTAP